MELCYLCNKEFKHKKYYHKGLIEVKEVELITHCLPGRRLLKDYDSQREKLLNLEYQIFCKNSEFENLENLENLGFENLKNLG